MQGNLITRSDSEHYRAGVYLGPSVYGRPLYLGPTLAEALAALGYLNRARQQARLPIIEVPEIGAKHVAASVV